MAPSHGVLLASEGGRRLLYALTNFSAANFLQSAVGGGEPGVASGWGGAILYRYDAYASAITSMFERLGIPSGSFSGYGLGDYLYTIAIGLAKDASTLLYPTRAYTYSPTDVGRILCYAWQLTPDGLEAWMSRGGSLGKNAAMTSYVPAAAGTRTQVGSRSGSNPAVNRSLLSWATWTGTPSAAQIDDYLMRARVLGDLPTTIQGGTVTHRESVRDQLRGTVVTSGQTGPAQLDDTITRAAADALARQGSPTVVTIDPSRDGRRMLGVLGNSAANYLVTSQAGAPIGGATTLTFRCKIRHDVVAGSQNIWIHTTDGGSRGFTFYQTAGAISVWSNASNAIVCSYAIGTADLGRTYRYTIVCTGSTWYLYRDGALLAQGAGTYSQSTSPLYVGTNALFTQPNTMVSIFDLAVGAGVATAAEILSTDAADRVVIAGRTDQYAWDFTRDLLAAGETVPAQILDRIGTNHLTRVGGHRVTADGKGLAGFSTQHLFATSPGLGLPGSTTGFWGEALIDCSGVNLSVPFACQSGNAGWMVRVSSVQAQIYLGNGTALTGAIVNWTPGGLRHLAFRYSPADAKIYLLVDGVQVAVADFAGPFSPATVGTILGALSAAGSTPLADSMGFYGAAGGYGEISNAELAAAAASALANRRVVGVPGKTLRRWDGGADITEAGGAVPNAYLRERVAGVEHAVRAGAPLQVAQRTDRVWSYETSPVTKVGTISAGNRWESDSATPLGESAAAGIIIGAVVRLKGTTSGRIIAHANGGLQGWNLSSSAGSVLSWGFVDGTTAKLLPNIVVSADSKFRAIMLHIEATQARAFHNRAQVGSATAIATGYTSADGLLGLAIGSWVGGGSLTPDAEVAGLYIGQGALSIAQFQAWEDACLAGETCAPVPGALGQHLWRFDRTSGLTLLDQIGSLHIPAIGSPVITDVYSRAWAR